MCQNDPNSKGLHNIKLVLDNLNESIPQLSIDCVIFGFNNNELKILLSKFAEFDLWALQAGFVRQDEDIDFAAQRIFEERTGLRNIYLHQFHVFGKADRPTSDFLEKKLYKSGYNIEDFPFLKQRFVTIGYYSLVDFQKVVPANVLMFEQIEWFDINCLPLIAYDHKEIILKALDTLRTTLDYSLVGFNLMPETFTMNELQKLYETILDEKLSRNNFQRKILEMDILVRLEKKLTGEAHKAPYLYQFKKNQNNQENFKQDRVKKRMEKEGDYQI